jgi:hypothetical protein
VRRGASRLRNHEGCTRSISITYPNYKPEDAYSAGVDETNDLALLKTKMPKEFRRVLRPGGWAAVSVNTVPARSYNHQINVILTRYVPGLAEAVTRTFFIGRGVPARRVVPRVRFRAD